MHHSQRFLTLSIFNWSLVSTDIFRVLTIISHFQILLSSEDLKMMIDEVSGRKGSGFDKRGTPLGPGTVNLQTFLQLMGNSSW